MTLNGSTLFKKNYYKASWRLTASTILVSLLNREVFLVRSAETEKRAKFSSSENPTGRFANR
jgi:hypothetical protein